MTGFTTNSVASYIVPEVVFNQIAQHYGFALDARATVDGARLWQRQDGTRALVATLGELTMVWNPAGSYIVSADRRHPVRHLITELLVELKSIKVLVSPDNYARLVDAAVNGARLRGITLLDELERVRTLELILELAQRDIPADADPIVVCTVDYYVRLVTHWANSKLARLP